MMGAQDVIRDSLVRRIYNINEKDFDGVALEVWKYQYDFNPLYRSYCDLLGMGSSGIRYYDEIPFLPIVMFREHFVKTGEWDAETVFRSSGTTGSLPGMHAIRDLNWYHSISDKCFNVSFGNAGDYTWLGLLPSYLERTDSSLVDMVHYFMLSGHHPESGFFPKVKDDILHVLHGLKSEHRRVILIGVSFALLDLFEQMEVPVWNNLLVIETGGMKGRGQEMTREELYSRMRQQHHHKTLRIASEYGMTELLSQAYKAGDYFRAGPTLRIRIRDVSDPLRLIDHGQRGVINIIDLANIDTCSFIATDDIGISFEDGSFDVLGRLDNSDLRGCNLLYV